MAVFGAEAKCRCFRGGAAACRAGAATSEPANHWVYRPEHGLSRRTRRAAFAKRLGGLGWVEGRSIAIEYRWAEGVVARRRDRAEYAQQKVDVIVVSGDAQVLAAKRATAVIPIVIAASADPVGNGLGESLARPGGNVTCDAVSPFPGQDSQRREAGDVGIEQTRKFKLVTTL